MSEHLHVFLTLQQNNLKKKSDFSCFCFPFCTRFLFAYVYKKKAKCQKRSCARERSLSKVVVGKTKNQKSKPNKNNHLVVNQPAALIADGGGGDQLEGSREEVPHAAHATVLSALTSNSIRGERGKKKKKENWQRNISTLIATERKRGKEEKKKKRREEASLLAVRTLPESAPAARRGTATSHL